MSRIALNAFSENSDMETEGGKNLVPGVLLMAAELVLGSQLHLQCAPLISFPYQ